MPRSRSFTIDEVDALHDFASYNSSREAAYLFLEWQAERKTQDPWNFDQVFHKIRAMQVPRLDGISLNQWSKILGVPRQRITGAYHTAYPRQELPIGLKMSQVKKMIVKDPRMLAGCNRSNAAQLFGEDFLSSLDIPKTVYRKQVRNKTTGEVFESIAAAAKKYYVDPKAIVEAMDIRQGKSAGCYWERV